MPEVFLCLVDGSAHADRAFHAALKFKKDEDTLYILHSVVFPDHLVLTPTPFGLVASDASILTRHREVIKERGEKVCEHYQVLCVEANVSNVHIVLLESPSDPMGEVCDFARENHVTHAFVGSRGLGKLKSALLGSFSAHILRHIHCNVTLAK